MNVDSLTTRLPSLLRANTELFSGKDLQELDNTLATLESQSEEEADETLSKFYVEHRHIRDALRKLSNDTRELGKVPPTDSKQSVRLKNFFQDLRQQVQDKLKTQSKSE